MTQTDAQKKAALKYKTANVHQFALPFFPKDEDLWRHLQAQPRKAEYLRELIRDDLEKVRAKSCEL